MCVYAKDKHVKGHVWTETKAKRIKCTRHQSTIRQRSEKCVGVTAGRVVWTPSKLLASEPRSQFEFGEKQYIESKYEFHTKQRCAVLGFPTAFYNI